MFLVMLDCPITKKRNQFLIVKQYMLYSCKLGKKNGIFLHVKPTIQNYSSGKVSKTPVGRGSLKMATEGRKTLTDPL